MTITEAAVVSMLLGAAAGDSIGATYEFQTAARVRRDYRPLMQGGGPFGWRPGQPTDDTDLGMCYLRTLGVGDSSPLARMQEWLAAGPADVGAATSRALRSDRSIRPYVPPADAIGNGALMRSQSLALVPFDDGQRLAKEWGELTHSTTAEVQCYVAMLHDALHGRDIAPRIAKAGFDGLYVSRITDGPGTARVSLTVAVACVKEPTLEACVQKACEYGNDTDTNACIAAGLWCAVNQPADHEWFGQLEVGDEIKDLVPTALANWYA